MSTHNDPSRNYTLQDLQARRPQPVVDTNVVAKDFNALMRMAQPKPVAPPPAEGGVGVDALAKFHAAIKQPSQLQLVQKSTNERVIDLEAQVRELTQKLAEAKP